MNRFLSECGLGSRRKVEELIKTGRIEVNNNIVTDLTVKINPQIDKVKYDGELLRPQKKVYYLLNKPKGFVTTLNDEKKRKTVIELINTNKRIFPVGRLDYNTTGVLLLTNDGQLTNFLLHPRNKIEREYVVVINKPLHEKDSARLLKGIFLDGRKSFFLALEYIKKGNKILKVTTNEGRYHFVKRMFQALGYNVVELRRIRFGPFNLSGLKIGEYREISETELKKLVNYEKFI
ncbi:pseudouridine synthase [Melioribacteraceae bacterium 4301-Me]|uniref:pseudouridine synthase n=1 Tax=Pyranulibacter aquaticus TaxID=3163344 RepID=UPI00359753B2